MSELIEHAEAALEAVRISGNEPVGAVGLIAALVGALKLAPARAFVDDLGRKWEWCGGEPGTWEWRVTSAAHAQGAVMVLLPEPDGGGEDEDGQLYFADYAIRVDCTDLDPERPVITDFGLGREFKTEIPAPLAWSFGSNLIAAAFAADPNLA